MTDDIRFDRDMQTLLEQLPEEQLPAARVTPWRQAMRCVLWGIGLTSITLNFWNLQHLLPMVGSILLMLGFRTLRQENGCLRSCWRLSIALAALRGGYAVVMGTVLSRLVPWLEAAIAWTLSILFWLVCLGLWWGMREIGRKAGQEKPSAKAAGALVLWYGVLILTGLLGQTLQGAALWLLLALYIIILRQLTRLTRALDNCGYAVEAAPVRLDGRWLDTPAGIAHYLEHKMFDTKEGNALQELAKNGAEPNAFTASSLTGYYFDCTEHFEENLKILLRFVSVPYFTQESVDKERGIIGQEIRMVEDTPDWRVYTNLLECLYHSSPARVAIAGTVESIAEITPETLYACHKAFYDPANMMLCVVGDVKPDEIAAIAEEILPNSRGEVIERDYGQEDMRVVEKCRREAMEVSMPQFLVGFKCPPAADGAALMRQDIIADIACDILLGDSSPLYQRLYDKGLINGSFGYSFDILPGAAYVYAGGDSNDPRAVKAAILAETERLLKDGIDADYWMQLQRANFGSTLKSLNSFESVAMSAVEGCFHGYDPFQFPEFYESISRQDLLDFIRENICEDRAALSAIYPKEEPSPCAL